ncbi:probable ribonuclease H2 subunit C at N-terminal half [Coccomyxa sp. Obi]|nr:probable ribonuclease H2 subunit C at N-terminal half [Coccomyxa sp. Obi]
MEEPRTLHWLPCSIKYTGVAKVGAYFLPTPTGTSVDGKAVQEAYFRGRQLKGTQLQLPQGYRGQILRRTAEEHADGDSTPQWSPDMAFREFVYWKHGLDPICTDSAQRRMAFLKMSEQLHAPVSSEEIQQELENPTFGKTS